MMRKVLVTGGIASGKSEVCRRLALNGYPVYDSDSRTKALYDSVPGLKKRIEDALELPFENLSEIFENPSKLETLEGIVHPLVLEDFRKWTSEQKGDVVFFESAIALEKPLFKDEFDSVILVEAPLAVRRHRNPKVGQRAHLQKFDKSRADVVIRNNGTLESLYAKIDKLYENRSC